MKILIVEDEYKIAQALKKGLEQESFAVDVVTNGKQGKSYALSDDYDLVILDRMLPDISDGLEICTAMRTKGIHTPVLMLTAKDQVRDRVGGLDSGADDYLSKPFAFEELVARVQALLRRPPEALSTTLCVGDLELNTGTHEVRRNGNIITLSLKEYALLDYLLRNKGVTVSKEAIIRHVWDDEADILPNSVEVYVGYLRNKIDKPFSHASPLIHTVRGFGYKIEELS